MEVDSVENSSSTEKSSLDIQVLINHRKTNFFCIKLKPVESITNLVDFLNRFEVFRVTFSYVFQKHAQNNNFRMIYHSVS